MFKCSIFKAHIDTNERFSRRFVAQDFGLFFLFAMLLEIFNAGCERGLCRGFVALLRYPIDLEIFPSYKSHYFFSS